MSLIGPKSHFTSSGDLEQHERLSQYERQIAQAFLQGQSRTEISHERHMSVDDINLFVQSIIGKMRANNLAHALIIAMRRGEVH